VKLHFVFAIVTPLGGRWWWLPSEFEPQPEMMMLTMAMMLLLLLIGPLHSQLWINVSESQGQDLTFLEEGSMHAYGGKSVAIGSGLVVRQTNPMMMTGRVQWM